MEKVLYAEFALKVYQPEEQKVDSVELQREQT